MSTGVENSPHLQYAADPIGSLAPVDYLSNPPAEPSKPPTLNGLHKVALYTASLGRLEGPHQSLATIFKMQDLVSETLGRESPLIEERLDLCILASICAALDHLGTYSMAMVHAAHPPNHLYQEQVSRGTPLERRIRHDVNRIDRAALYLTKAKYLLYHVLEARNSKVADASIDLFVNEFGEKSRENKTGHPRLSKVRQRIRKDEVHGYIVRGLIRSAQEGDIEDDTSDCGRMESIVQFMRSKDVHPEIHPLLIARFMSYAYMNKARKVLEVEASRDTYAKPIPSQHLIPVMCCIARANDFMNAILPFLIDPTGYLPGV